MLVLGTEDQNFTIPNLPQFENKKLFLILARVPTWKTPFSHPIFIKQKMVMFSFNSKRMKYYDVLACLFKTSEVKARIPTKIKFISHRSVIELVQCLIDFVGQSH